MQSHRKLFTIAETHGILQRPGNQVLAQSDDLGWSSLHASASRETAYEGSFAALPHHLLVMHLDGPVAVSQILGSTTVRRRVLPGGFFMLPGRTDFGVCLHGALNTVHIYVREGIVEEVAADLLPGDPSGFELIPRVGDHDPLLEQLALATREAIIESDSSMPAYGDYLARAVAARLVRGHSIRGARAAPAHRLAAGGLTQRQIDLTREFLAAHLDERLNLERMAAANSLSPVNFARRFKHTTGLTPHQQLLAMRIERAKHLLAESPMEIVEIAIECGFSHQQHLTRMFHRHTGATPAAFRRTRRL